MTLSYHRIAYEALDVCNAVEMATLEAAIRRTGLIAGSRALDIGCGNGAVSIQMAERFGFTVEAVELDADMAGLAGQRIAASKTAKAVTLNQTRSAEVLKASPPFDLIVALGATQPVGGGIRDPRGMMAGLAEHLVPGGWLLWGDLVWLSPPSDPLRQIVEMTNTYADHDGWQVAAHEAGFRVVSAEVSSPDLWTRYRATMDTAVRDWLSAHRDHADAAAIRARADQIAMMLDFGEGYMGFGLYLLQLSQEA